MWRTSGAPKQRRLVGTGCTRHSGKRSPWEKYAGQSSTQEAVVKTLGADEMCQRESMRTKARYRWTHTQREEASSHGRQGKDEAHDGQGTTLGVENRQSAESRTAESVACPREAESHSSNLSIESSAALDKGPLRRPKLSAGVKLLGTLQEALGRFADEKGVGECGK